MIGQKTDFTVQATLDAEGNAAVTVAGARSYGKTNIRHARVTRDITDKKQLEAIGVALKKAIVDVRESLDEESAYAAAECLHVAGKKKEAA